MPAKNILPVKYFAVPAAQVQPETAIAAFAVKDFKLCLISSSIDNDRKRNWLSILKSQTTPHAVSLQGLLCMYEFPTMLMMQQLVTSLHVAMFPANLLLANVYV